MQKKLVRHFMALDPGETSGFAILDADSFVLLESGELDSWHGIKNLIMRWQPNVIIYETFRLYPGSARSLSWSELETVQVIGVTRYLAEQAGIECIGQPASARKAGARIPFSGDKPKGAHARDALLHALVYARRRARKMRKAGRK